MGAPVHSEIIIMKAFIFATVLAVAAAIPIEDTDDVKAAKVKFSAAFKAAQAGEHAKLAPLPVATAYLADLPEVSEARDAFRAVYDMYAAEACRLAERSKASCISLISSRHVGSNPAKVFIPYSQIYF